MKRRQAKKIAKKWKDLNYKFSTFSKAYQIAPNWFHYYRMKRLIDYTWESLGEFNESLSKAQRSLCSFNSELPKGKPDGINEHGFIEMKTTPQPYIDYYQEVQQQLLNSLGIPKKLLE